MRASTPDTRLARSVECNGVLLEFRVKTSKTAKQLRLRVNLDGVEVLRPADRPLAELDAFVCEHREWLQSQVVRIERLRKLRQPTRRAEGQILFRG